MKKTVKDKPSDHSTPRWTANRVMAETWSLRGHVTGIDYLMLHLKHCRLDLDAVPELCRFKGLRLRGSST